MIKKNTLRLIKKLSILAAASIGFVVLLHFSSALSNRYTGGGFQRNFVPSPLISVKSRDVKYNTFYIAGISGGKIYLGSQTAPLNLFVLTTDLQDSTVERIQLNKDEDLSVGRIKIMVDSSGYYVLNGIAPFIYQSKLSRAAPIKIDQEVVYFKDAVPVGTGVFGMRSESAVSHRDVIIRQDFLSTQITLDTTFLQRQFDGIFCTDGMLHYSATEDKLVYIYFYRNEYIEADPDLGNISRFKTIDTTTTAKISIATIESDGTKTLAAPTVVVNKRSSVSGDWLYVQSGLLADNQQANEFEHFEVIDVYHLPTHDYRFSFYLPLQRGKRISSFAVTGNLIVVLFEQYLFVYEIAADLLNVK